MGDTPIWAGDQISTSITSRIPITTDEDGCPAEEQPFSPTTENLQHLAPLWEHSFHDWAQFLGRGLDGAPISEMTRSYSGPTSPCVIPSLNHYEQP
jgi:hypothetical protein